MRREMIILVVDDEVIVRNVVQRALRSAGFSVLVAGDGVEALQVARACPALDLVVTDIEMPVMGGFAFAEKLGADRPKLPVVFISGRLSPGTRIPAPFLAKPFLPEALLAVIHSVLFPPEAPSLSADATTH